MKKRIISALVGVMALSILTCCGEYSNEYLLDETYADYVKLADYKGVEATKVTFEITRDEIDEAVEEMMYDYISYDEITDRGAKEGDNANITYVATIDGKENEDYSGEDEDIVVGEGYMYPEVENALIGMKSGDSKDVSVELTDEYAEEEFVGKTAKIKLTLNDLTEDNYPEYNDDFVKENLDYDTVAEYEESVKQDLTKEKENEYKEETVGNIIQQVIDNSEFNGYPEELYDLCESDFNANNEYMASMYQMELSEYEELIGLDEDTKKEQIEDSVHGELVIGAIAQAEKITVTEKDIDQFVKASYEEYGFDTEDEFIEEYGQDEIGYYLTYQKVSDVLYNNANLKEITEDEYYQQQEAEFNVDASDDVEEEADDAVAGDAEADKEDNVTEDAETDKEDNATEDTETDKEDNASEDTEEKTE